MDGQVPRLVLGQVAVLLPHAGQGFLDGGVAAGQAAAHRPALLDPLAPALGGGQGALLDHAARREAQPLDGDKLAHRLGIQAGVAQRDHAAERVGDDGHRRQLLLVDQLGQVVDIGGGVVDPVRRPGAVAVAAQVRGDDVPVVAQLARHPVPAAAMVASAMHQQQRRGGGIAPVDIVQPQPLRDEDVRGRPGKVVHRHGP